LTARLELNLARNLAIVSLVLSTVGGVVAIWFGHTIFAFVNGLTAGFMLGGIVYRAMHRRTSAQVHR
jgi:hypothetical protein